MSTIYTKILKIKLLYPMVVQIIYFKKGMYLTLSPVYTHTHIHIHIDTDGGVFEKYTFFLLYK